jgi:hypothetical protein
LTHGPVHILIGGAWDDRNEYLDSFSTMKATSRILVFKVLWRMGYTRCPSECDVSKSDYCKCAVPDEFTEAYGAQKILAAVNYNGISSDDTENYEMLRARRNIRLDPSVRSSHLTYLYFTANLKVDS